MLKFVLGFMAAIVLFVIYGAEANAGIFDKQGDFALAKIVVYKANNGDVVGEMEMETESGLTAEGCVAKANQFIEIAKQYSDIQSANATCTYSAVHVNWN